LLERRGRRPTSSFPSWGWTTMTTMTSRARVNLAIGVHDLRFGHISGIPFIHHLDTYDTHDSVTPPRAVMGGGFP
jgi:hypothetical protein